MTMKEEFGSFHPVVNMLFYCVVMGITMFYNNPFFIIISFICASIYLIIVSKEKSIKNFMGMIGLFICASLINPLFSHRGVTLLFYLPTGNPVTLESIIFGIAAAGILVTVMLWFFTFHKIMTSDKIMALFGKILPGLSLIFSMVLKFVPDFTRHLSDTKDVNEILAVANEEKRERISFIQKIKIQIDNFSITSTWALENSVDTADSMASRGYGVEKRTNFDNYKLTVRDFIAIIWIVILAAGVVGGISMGIVTNYYYPAFYIDGKKYSEAVYIMYAMLCITPILINLVEEIRWLRLKSKI